MLPSRLLLGFGCNRLFLISQPMRTLQRETEAVAAYRAKRGYRHLGTLVALADLAVNLQEQGKLTEAEPLFREVVAARREVSGNDDVATIKAVGNLGKVLLEQGKLAEAELLLVEAVAYWRKNNRVSPNFAALVELRRKQGRLPEAEQELGTLVADMREAWGAQNPYTLEAEAVAARLRHAQPDGKGPGAEELRAVVQRMGEFLGAAHHFTIKWQRVLDKMGPLFRAYVRPRAPGGRVPE